VEVGVGSSLEIESHGALRLDLRVAEVLDRGLIGLSVSLAGLVRVG